MKCLVFSLNGNTHHTIAINQTINGDKIAKYTLYIERGILLYDEFKLTLLSEVRIKMANIANEESFPRI